MSRTVPGGRPEWPHDPSRSESYGGEQRAPGNGYHGYGDGRGAPEQGQGQQGQGEYDRRDQYDGEPGQYSQYGQDDGRGYGSAQANGGQGYDGQGYDGRGYGSAQANGGQGYDGQGYDGQGYDGQGYDGYGQQGYGQQSSYGDRNYPGGNYPGQGWGPGDQPAQGYGNQPTQRYDRPGQQDDTWYYRDAEPDEADEADAGPGRAGRSRPPARKVRLRRTRRFFRRRIVRAISAVLAVFILLVMFSAGQAAFKNNGQGIAANLAEWARDHYLGPVVTFGEWLTYNPPPKGGKPSFSLAVPSNERITSSHSTKGKKHGFQPDIPGTLTSLAGKPITGEGQWRVVEKVHGEPAILTTFLRDATYTSEVNGIASIDQRLVRFSLRPGTEDPGAGNWGVPNYIPPGQRTGVLATFNGGFRLNASGGGFYLHGTYHGSLVNGAASIVYYKNGTIKIGEWGRDFTMNSSIEGVRQNLKLLVDHGKVSADANSDVMTNWGATLGGGYYQWRSGIGITKDGRVIYVYGPALNAQDLGELLQRAGAVEGMQMDINPAWMKFDYYEADGHASDPTPVPLLPIQQPSPYSYYTPSTRDFTAVYAR